MVSTSQDRLELKRQRQRENTARYRERHPERVKQARSKWLISNPDGNRSSARKRLYGVTADQFSSMLEGQGRKCAICRTPFSDTLKGPFVDHHHGSGSVRGLLCIQCNSGIGFLRDSPDILDAAARYVRNGGSAGL